MTYRLPCFAPRRRFLAVLGFGLLAGLTALDAPAAPPAPVAPIVSAVTRFTDNNNGTVTDGMTGLIWLKNASCFGTPQPWGIALSVANGLANGACGLADGSSPGQWRLPNRNELQSLIDYTSNPTFPANNPSFTSVQSGSYWSSTTSAAGGPSYAWYVNLLVGFVSWDPKDLSGWVWPVRGGQ